MTDRGERRAQKERNLNRWRRVVRSWTGHSSKNDESWVERVARRLAGHGKLCSCPMCGNRRRYEGETMQEKRADQPT